MSAQSKPAEIYFQWDIRNWSKALPCWEKALPPAKPQTGAAPKALELGGREGGLSLWLAQKGFQVICSDLSGAEATASPLHRQHGVTAKITYADIDASNIPFENEFDVVVFKSIIGGIGRNNNKEIQREVFAQIHKALKPGGKLLFAENLTASPLHKFFRRRFTNWSGYWRYVTEAELREFMQPFSSVEIHTTGFAGTFGRSEKQKNFLARTDEWLWNAVTPRSWKYIAYGVAVK
ncbi:MAG: class I SAM-dependent methyltransferase [Bacteroidia bacterium]|jgi:SAM-dependent methyltransferase|nr:class I SAM-dependent methyltransferase [Bacteroidia bacterium]